MANFAYLAIVYFLSQLPSFLDDFRTQDAASDYMASSLKPEYIRNDTEEFDYVIVGAGSAGSVIAARLAATGRSVLVLERGGTPNPIASIQVLWTMLAYDTGTITRYPTVPQANLANRILNPPAAKVLGGGSSVNALNFIRGSPGVFDDWARITGDSAWSWKRVLPYFKRSENYHGVFSDPVDSTVHGVDGPLYIEPSNLVQPSTQILFAALEEKGLRLRDLNANLSVGYQPIEFNMKKGRRCGVNEGYLQPALATRPNLRVYSYATATKIHLGLLNRAYGVTYVRHGATRFVRARREVIVSAGVFESPRLLMLSGIGPRSDLEALGIQSKVNLPVGQNVQDHLSISLTFALAPGLTWVPERDMTPKDEVDYLTTGYGPFHNDVADNGFITSTQLNDPNFPDLHLFFHHQATLGSDPTAPPRTDTNIGAAFLARPFSYGSIRLSGVDPSAPLVVDLNYGGDPSDIPRLVEGVKFLVDLYENSTAYSQAGGAKLVDSYFPCGAFPYRSDAYWDCVTRTVSAGGIHYAGSCRMGKLLFDPKAVVDSQLRVLGTLGLRVADASVMPVVPNSNPNAAVIMIGERASDLIINGF